jgi:CDP-diacylglycerol---serine O-phosphatidyltransferase
MRPRNRQAYILVLPSLFTTGNLFCGFYAIIRSFSGEFEWACYAIVFAGIFDVLDGRVARLTKSTSKFGVEYDSIADVVSFGVAPAILAYVWLLQPLGRAGWAAAFFFAACGALRLARFNTISEELPKSYFLGLPIPAAANAVGATYLSLRDLPVENMDKILMFELFALGLLMVSNIRYKSPKDFNIRHKGSFFLLVFALIVLTFLVIRPAPTLIAFFGAYVISGPLREIVVRMRRGKGDRLTPHLYTSEEELEGKRGGKS